MITFMPLLLAAITTSLTANGVDATTPGILSICALTSRHSTNVAVLARDLDVRVGAEDLLAQVGLEAAHHRQHAARARAVPIHTPPIGTVVKNVKTRGAAEEQREVRRATPPPTFAMTRP